MATMYITEQGATLRKEHNRLVVELNETRLAEVHEFKIDRVVVFGNVQLTTQVMNYLLERGIDTAFLSSHGRLKGRLAPLMSKNAPLRLRQYELARDQVFANKMAQAVVTGKIANSRTLLDRHQRNHPECRLDAEINQLAAYEQKAASQAGIDSLRGIEGQAAAVYFQGFAKMLRRRMQFVKRTRRPPGDPINAMLSFGYTLLYNEAIGALAAVGFDPYFGFFHRIHYGRCSLALDLMEEMRALVSDRLTLSLVNLEVVKREDFTSEPDGGVLLSDEARKKFLREYERVMMAEFTHRQAGTRISLRRALHEQALVLQRAMMRREAYRAFQGWS